jgi:CheY-like chemotaxis protein
METNTKIMIVDDNKMDALFLQQMITILNYPVETKSFRNSIEAIQSLQDIITEKKYADFPQLIFLDLNMPEMSGFSFLDAFMKLPIQVVAKCKIIIITASSDLEDLKKSAGYPNVVDFIVKPPQRMEQIVKQIFSEN